MSTAIDNFSHEAFLSPNPQPIDVPLHDRYFCKYYASPRKTMLLSGKIGRAQAKFPGTLRCTTVE
jgi:hypothetical protein